MTEKSWATRIGYAAWIIAAAGAIAMVVGATMVRYADDADKLDGFSWVPLGMMIAAGGVVLAIVALIWKAATKRGGARPAVLGLFTGAVPLAWLAFQILSAGNVPAIHDVTTDLDDPPAFTALTLPEDNLRGLENEAQWRELHEGAYGDIQPITLSRPVSEVIAAATALAEERGWEIVASAPESGRLEATDTVSYYRFKDDVVLRVTATDDGSQVDMRSVSRVGISDLGYNAERIRAFLTDLETQIGT